MATEVGRPAAGGAGVPVRVGLGFDVHRLVPGRPLRLGGVEIPFELGLMGHSDGDVLLHAMADAVLGAAGLGDIGLLFPDTEPAFASIDSRRILQRAVELARQSGWELLQLDTVVVAERPRLAPRVPAMAAAVRQALAMPQLPVSIKAKTAEGLGPVGAGEAIAALAVALVGARSAP